MFDTASSTESSVKSVKELPYTALREEPSPTIDNRAASSHRDQVLHERDSYILPWEKESEVDSHNQDSGKNPLNELDSNILGKVRSFEKRSSFRDVKNGGNASTSIGRDGVIKIDGNLPKSPISESKSSRPNSPLENISSFVERQKNLQEAYPKEQKRGKMHRKIIEPRIYRQSSTHTDSLIKDELFHLSIENLLKKVREKIEQCKDIPIALEHFLNSQINPRISMDEVITIDNNLKHTAIVMKRICGIAERAHEHRDLNSLTVSDLEILVVNLGMCLDVLESDFGLFEVSHMDIETQQETWDEMLLDFEMKNYNSLVDHLQVICSFGNALLTSLRAGTNPSQESDEFKAILLEMNRVHLSSSLAILPKKKALV